MTLDAAKKILRIFGVLGIIGGVFTLIMGLITMVAGGMVAGGAVEVDPETAEAFGAVALVSVIVLIITGIVTLLEGVFSVQASRNPKKAQPAWIFAIIGVIGAIIGVITNLKGGLSSIGGPLCTLIINCGIFVAANTVKKAGDEM